MTSKIFQNCIHQAKETDELFPVDCIEILEKHYGEKRMSLMVPKTLFNKVHDLMGTITDTPDEIEIKECVNRYLKS